jgi:hypothetical protein
MNHMSAEVSVQPPLWDDLLNRERGGGAVGSRGEYTDLGGA